MWQRFQYSIYNAKHFFNLKKKWTKNEIQLNVNQKGTIEKEITNKLNAQKTKCPEHSELKIKGKKIKIKIINERRWCRVAFYMKHDSYRNLYTRLKWEYFLGFAVSNFFLLPFSVCTVRLTPWNSHSQSQSQIQTFFSHSHEYITHLTSLNFVSFEII